MVRIRTCIVIVLHLSLPDKPVEVNALVTRYRYECLWRVDGDVATQVQVEAVVFVLHLSQVKVRGSVCPEPHPSETIGDAPRTPGPSWTYLP